jgi:hypothetical protein
MESNKTDKVARIIALIIVLAIGGLVFWTGGTILYYIIKYSFFS